MNLKLINLMQPDESQHCRPKVRPFAIRRERLMLIFNLLFLFGFSLTARLVAEDASVPASLHQFEQQLKSIGQTTTESVVLVAAVSAMEEQQPLVERFSSLFHPQASQLPGRLGVGAIVESTRERILILTTSHLIEPVISRRVNSRSAELLVKLKSNQVFVAKVIAADPRSELALLQVEIDSSNANSPRPSAIKFAESLRLAKGTLLVAVGNPWEIARDGSASFSAAVLTNIQRSSANSSQVPQDERTLHDLGTLLEFDLPQRFTASGTVLVTLQGEIAGLVHSQSLPLANGDSVSYAIPMSAGFVRIIEELKQGLEVEYGFLGVSSETSQPDALSKLSLSGPQNTGAMVIRVPENSPAEQAGILREDIILRVNESLVESSEDLVREVGLLKPQTDVEIVLFRNGDGIKSVTAKLGKWPIYDDTFLFKTQERYPAWSGIQVDYATARRRYLPDRFLGVFPSGVVVSSVTPEAIADLAGLQVGQFIVKVNGQTVETPQQFYTIVEKSDDEVQLTLADGKTVTVVAN